MAKFVFKNNPRVAEIFDDLESFREFCVYYGHYFDEKEMYCDSSRAWRHYERYQSGKDVRDIWTEDAAVFAR